MKKSCIFLKKKYGQEVTFFKKCKNLLKSFIFEIQYTLLCIFLHCWKTLAYKKGHSFLMLHTECVALGGYGKLLRVLRRRREEGLKLFLRTAKLAWPKDSRSLIHTKMKRLFLYHFDRVKKNRAFFNLVAAAVLEIQNVFQIGQKHANIITRHFAD